MGRKSLFRVRRIDLDGITWLYEDLAWNIRISREQSVESERTA